MVQPDFARIARRLSVTAPIEMNATIDELIETIPELAGRDVVVTPLSGGLTNSNYKIDCGQDSYVLRVAGERTALLGIDRQCEHACAVAAASIDVGPEVVAFVPEHELMVTRFLEGNVVTNEDSRKPAVMQRIVEAIRRYHESPAGVGRFCAFDGVRSYHELAKQHGVTFPAKLDQALRILNQIEEGLGPNQKLYPCHNDLLPANFIDDGARVRLIDWEYAGMGDRFFDLANLAVNHLYDEGQERALLKFYFGEVTDGNLHRLRLMRLVSDMRESMWGFLQSGISALEIDFQDYACKHLDRFLSGAERNELMAPI